MLAVYLTVLSVTSEGEKSKENIFFIKIIIPLFYHI